MIQAARIAMLLASNIVSMPVVNEGMATYYNTTGPLYAHPHHSYSTRNGLEWCAANVMSYVTGQVQPGDRLLIHFIDYDKLIVLEAWDAGPFDGYYIADYPELPILVDIPQHLWPLDWQRSARVEVVNISAMGRN